MSEWTKNKIILQVPQKPCAECDDCIPIGNGEGLCDYPRKIDDKKIVDLFDIESDCPKMKTQKEK